MKNVVVLLILVMFFSCAGESSFYGQESSEKDLTMFIINGVEAKITGNDVILELPYGVGDFESVKVNDYYYIDKTMYIPKLEMMRYVFLIRPRRFGKTLHFLSTYSTTQKKSVKWLTVEISNPRYSSSLMKSTSNRKFGITFRVKNSYRGSSLPT